MVAAAVVFVLFICSVKILMAMKFCSLQCNGQGVENIYANLFNCRYVTKWNLKKSHLVKCWCNL